MGWFAFLYFVKPQNVQTIWCHFIISIFIWNQHCDVILLNLSANMVTVVSGVKWKNETPIRSIFFSQSRMKMKQYVSINEGLTVSTAKQCTKVCC